MYNLKYLEQIFSDNLVIAMNNVKNSLDRIIRWFKANSSQTIECLNPPASDREIEQVESKTDLKLPDAFKELLKTFNGENGQLNLALFGDGNLMLSCDEIVNQFELDKKITQSIYNPEMETLSFWKDRVHNKIIFVKGSVKPMTSHQKWLPFTCMNGDVYRYLDFDPAPGGKMGQVIEVDPESCSYHVIADSIEEFLENYAVQLENGEFSAGDDGYVEANNHSNEMNWGIPQWLKE